MKLLIYFDSYAIYDTYYNLYLPDEYLEFDLYILMRKQPHEVDLPN